MSSFETILSEVLKVALVAGQIMGPVFIHSAHGIAIFNASEETVATLVSAAPLATTPSTPTPAA